MEGTRGLEVCSIWHRQIAVGIVQPPILEYQVRRASLSNFREDVTRRFWDP